MRIKIDENLAAAHKRLLAAAGHDVQDVHDEDASGVVDAELWRRVSEEQRFLITLDHDFSDVRAYPPGSHAGILLVRTNHPSGRTVATILQRLIGEGLDRLAGCLAVADEVRTRVRRPPTK